MRSRLNPDGVLGWHDSHCASAALLSPDGRVRFAAAEERFNKKKLYRGHPAGALAETGAQFPGLRPDAAYCDLPLDEKIRRNAGLAWHSWRNGLNTAKSARTLTQAGWSRMVRGQFAGVAGTDEHVRVRRRERADGDRAKDDGYDSLCEHHTAHAASAYYLSGFRYAWVVTIDGVGDCLSGCICEGRDGLLIRRRSFYYNELTVGADYETLTAMLGFNPDRHCGKITGLAAYGRYHRRAVQALDAFFADSWKAGRRNWFDRMHGPGADAVLAELRAVRRERFGRFTREDLAFAMQYLAEQRVLALIRENIPSIGTSNIALAGGVFANVRINQKVKELGFENIFVCPAMDDGGLSLGAALHHLSRHTRLEPCAVPHMFLGPAYGEEEIGEALERHGLVYDVAADPAGAIAERIAAGEIVARFDGAMEFGPRALGNRSILYDTRDPSVNDWLNRRLRRTEFMPFAPATLAEQALRCYRGLDGCRHTAEFMTITFDCTEEMKRLSPAVVHLDGTARAQLVTREANPSLHAIVEAYHELTGIPSLVNTSFNMHESPIVMTPDDAIRSFLEGRLDHLAIGRFLVSRRANERHVGRTEATSSLHAAATGK